MNERIRELMKQSGAYEYYEIYDGDEGNDEKPMAYFAELIVKECLGIIESSSDSLLKPASYYYIKQHFGVENE